MVRDTDFPFPVEAAVLTVQTGSPSEATLLWHVRGTSRGDAVQLPFFIIGLGKDELARLALTNYQQWDPRTDRLGIAFPAGTDILLRKIEFFHWSVPEKMASAFWSFWVMDGFRPYSINFLWGPRIAMNPLALERIFMSLPPNGFSAMYFFYGVLATAGAGLLLIGKVRPGLLRGRPPLVLFLVASSACWLLLELRMGAEILNYAVTDYKTYIGAERGERTFRERAHFNDFVEAAMPYIQTRGKYVFMSAQRWPFFGEVRYLTYPSLPVDPDASIEKIDTVVVFERPDITVNDKGELQYENEKLSTPGEVLLQFDDSSFVFRIRGV